MKDLLSFIRKENSKPYAYGVATQQVQKYTEVEFDLMLGAYEAKCLLQYVALCGGVCGGDQCLLLPYAEETTQKMWCNQLDHLALKELHRTQHKKQTIKKRDLKDYRSHARAQRSRDVCDIRIVHRKKALPLPPTHAQSDSVYDFSTLDDEESKELMLKTQSVIDSIKRLNYLSDSASEFSCPSRQSSCSLIGLDEEGDGGIFGDFSVSDSLEQYESNSVEEFQHTASTVSSYMSVTPTTTP